MYLLAEVAVGFANGFVGSLLQQKLDNYTVPVNWGKALEDGVNGAISSALPPLGGTLSKSGNYARHFHCLDQTFRRGKVYSLC